MTPVFYRCCTLPPQLIPRTTTILCVTASNSELELCRSNGATIYTIYDTFGEQMRVLSPGYPENYNVGNDCVDYILIDTALPVELDLEQHYHHTDCYPRNLYRIVNMWNVLLDISGPNYTCTPQHNSNVSILHTRIKIEQSRPLLRLVLPPGNFSGFEFFVSGNDNITYNVRLNL